MYLELLEAIGDRGASNRTHQSLTPQQCDVEERNGDLDQGYSKHPLWMRIVAYSPVRKREGVPFDIVLPDGGSLLCVGRPPDLV